MTTVRLQAVVYTRLQRQLYRLVGLAVLWCVAAPTGAHATVVRTEAAWFQGDDPSPQPVAQPVGYNVIRHDVVVDDFTWRAVTDTNALPGQAVAVYGGTVRTTVVVRQAPLTELTFLLGRSTVQRVTDARGKPLDHAVSNGGLVVTLASPAALGDTVRITLGFTAEERNVTTKFPLGQTGTQWHDSHWLLTSGWDLAPTLVSTTNQVPTPWSLTMTLPSNYQVATEAEWVSDSVLPDGRHTVRARMEHPVSGSFSASVGEWSVARDTVTLVDGRRLPLFVYYGPGKARAAQSAMQRVRQTMEVFGRLTKTPFLYPSYSVIQRADVEAFPGAKGVATGGTTIVSDLEDPEAYANRPIVIDVYVHELGHDWFGGDDWLSEGGADFFLSQYLAAVEGPQSEQDALKFFTSEESFGGPGNGDPYGGGARLLYMLKRYLGDDRFWAMMQTVLQTKPVLRGLSVAGFVDAIKRSTGEDLRWFVDQWANHPGLPEFEVTAQYDAPTRRVTLQVKQVQGAEGTDAPEVYRSPVTIRVATPQGDVLATAQLTEREQTIVVDSVSAAPTMIVFDDKDILCKRLKFEQPTAWLVAQLTREPSGWQTWWAIHQLAERAQSDTVAAASLRTAALHGKHSLTRNHAIQVLGQYVPDPLPTITAALRDTSADVRKWAIRALASQPSEQVLPLLDEVVRKDPTAYLPGVGVETALKFDGLSDRPAQVAMVERALRADSPGQVSRGYILRLIKDMQGCPSDLAPIVEEMFAKHVWAVEAAASLAPQCLPFQVLLTRHRDDPRNYVRNWVQRNTSDSE